MSEPERIEGPESETTDDERRTFLATSAALLAAVAGAAVSTSCATGSGTRLGPPILRMREQDLRLITGERARAALGSSGTGSGTGCDGTTVHCCFNAAVAISRVGRDYVLEVPGGRHAIEVDYGS